MDFMAKYKFYSLQFNGNATCYRLFCVILIALVQDLFVFTKILEGQIIYAKNLASLDENCHITHLRLLAIYFNLMTL